MHVTLEAAEAYVFTEILLQNVNAAAFRLVAVIISDSINPSYPEIFVSLNVLITHFYLFNIFL
jgi:hypothetical protein